jgi:thymidylate synthase
MSRGDYMMKIPPTLLIQEKDFHNCWARAVRYVIRDGIPLVIGDDTEPKPIRDICATMELTGDAIRQIEDRELHTQFPFQHIDPYCEEFTREYLSHYLKKPDREQFSYLYFDRLASWSGDQIKMMRQNLKEQIKNGISSNRHQSLTWSYVLDPNSDSSPCLQRIWIRYLGDQSVEVHLTWRSRDGYGAFQANLVAIIDMINREIVRPNGCQIVKIVDFSNSFHIYMSDMRMAEKVKLVATSPMTR